jgi:hypothetical protein
MNVKFKEICKYLEEMIEDFNCGNDNEYKPGSKVKFLYEEDEKSNIDNYEEEDVKNFYEVREFIKNNGDKVKYIGEFNDKPLEYTFKVIGNDIECSWLEPKW